MDRYLSIVEEHTNLAIDKVKHKQFLAQTKVWEYARITEQDYKDISADDSFALLQDYYSYINKVTNQGTAFFFVSFDTTFFIYWLYLAKFVTILIQFVVFFYRTNRFDYCKPY